MIILINTEKPITEELLELKIINNLGEPVLDKDGKQKVEVKKNNPKTKIRSIAHLAIDKTAELLNKKYKINIKPYDLFGGTTELYIKNYFKKIGERIDFLDNKNGNIINKVLTHNFGNGKNFLNFDDTQSATQWALNYVEIIENTNNGFNFPLNDDCMYEIFSYVNQQLKLLFEDLKKANLEITRKESLNETNKTI